MEYSTADSSSPTCNTSPRLSNKQAAPDRRQRFLAVRAHTPLIVPSLLLCDFGHLADEVRRLEDAGARSFHLDVMDGRFVPNISYGLPIVEAVRRATSLPIEAHLMIADPAKYAEEFFEAGADALTFHYEAIDDPRPLLKRIREIGGVAGMAFNPSTPLDAIRGCLDDCDLVLTMSVSPGFGGQSFERVALEKLKQLHTEVGDRVLLEVDGGVNAKTIAECSAAGAALLVVGSAIFGQPDYAQSIAKLTELAQHPARNS